MDGRGGSDAGSNFKRCVAARSCARTRAANGEGKVCKAKEVEAVSDFSPKGTDGRGVDDPTHKSGCIDIDLNSVGCAVDKPTGLPAKASADVRSAVDLSTLDCGCSGTGLSGGPSAVDASMLDCGCSGTGIVD
eukprot:265181-Pleurochrysis_carterae.AAC.1